MTRVFPRYRMTCALPLSVAVAALPERGLWVPWHHSWIDQHAMTIYESFVYEPDALVYPNLANRTGCQMLMRSICDTEGFCAGATWLLAVDGEYVGSVQGVVEDDGIGLIQNVGIVPGHRRSGFGIAMIVKALHGLHAAGAKTGQLDVTVGNVAAIRLYLKLGFTIDKTIYRTVAIKAKRGRVVVGAIPAVSEPREGRRSNP